jgi:predicted metal-dependent hydrolase
MLVCTSPIPFRMKDLQRAIDELRPKLKTLLQKGREKAKAEGKHYTPETRIDTEDFQLSFQQSDDVDFASMDMGASGVVCHYHSPEVLADEQLQAWITQTLEALARERVREKLVPRLRALADQRGLKVNSVRVSSAKGRWGSCSTRSSINLSLYLVLLPRHLQDYVLQHELTHLLEMNHSPRFWALLDKACGQDSHALRGELRQYNTAFV